MTLRDRAFSTALAAFAPLWLALLVLASCQPRGAGDTGDDLATQPVGRFEIGARNSPDPPHVGDNRFTVVVRDASHQPVRGAAVEVMVSMPAMGAMPGMESRGKAVEGKPGVFTATYGLAMSGQWDAYVRVRPKQGSAVEASYRLNTSAPGLVFESGTPASSASSGVMASGDGAATETTASGVNALPGTVSIDVARRQEIGIRTAPVQVRDLASSVRAVGRVAYDERRQAEVSLKFGGWVRELRADFTGRPVRAGEVLFTAYSPELWSAQQEYIEALHAAMDSTLADHAESESELAAAARRRLELWDISPAEVQRIARSGKPRQALPILAPVSGVVTEKNVVRGSAFTAGQVLYKIAAVDPAWVIASVYQVDLPLLRIGMAATLTNPYLDERSRHGRVSFIAPALQADTRTGEVRIEVPNPRGDLKPEMFVNIELEARLGKRLAVPESAVLPAGERRIVFVDLGDGRLAPREVRLGARAGDYFEVLSGLAPGEIVVTSGNFLVAAESQLRAPAARW